MLYFLLLEKVLFTNLENMVILLRFSTQYGYGTFLKEFTPGPSHILPCLAPPLTP